MALHAQLLVFMICSFGQIFGQRPRVIFIEKDVTVVRRAIPAETLKIFIDEEEDVVTAVGTTHVQLMDPHMPLLELPVKWNETSESVFNLTLIHKTHGKNQMFVCGFHGRDAACCRLNISEHSVKCTNTNNINNINNINEHLRDFDLEPGAASAFVDGADGGLYVAYSGSRDSVGIHRFGRQRMRPAHRDTEQHYVELVVSEQEPILDVRQDKVYGFYNEKKKDRDVFSAMWRPYVTQLCLVDSGGPKNNLQFSWTSQMNAALFCGDKTQKLHFPELLSLETVEEEHWSHTRLYALFTNHWGTRAVCIFTLKDIDLIFKTSPFKNSDMNPDRPRTCVADSSRLRVETLKQIESSSEMELCVEPTHGSGPVLSSPHHYTLISAPYRLSRNYSLLFMALQNGRIHKVLQTGTEAFVISEYRLLDLRAHIVSLDLSLSAEKLYVTSQNEVIELNLENCASFGNSCELCVLSRDPLCGWSHDGCTRDGRLQDPEHGNLAVCPAPTSELRDSEDPPSADQVQVSLPLGSRYFLECPVRSLLAHYSWFHDDRPVSCSGARHQCLLFLPEVQAQQEGTYTCVSEEQGYRRLEAEYQLWVENTAAACSTGGLWGLTALLASGVI